MWPSIRLIGYGAKRPVFVLAPSTPGYQDRNAERQMVFFAGSRPGAIGARGGPAATTPPAAGAGRGGQPGARPADANPGTFYSAMSNIDIEIGDGNPGAVAIRGTYAQHCFLAHMDFRLGTALAGVHDTGNVMEDVRFFGGQYGIWTRTPSPGWQFTAVDISFEGQQEAAIRERAAGLTLIRPSFKNGPTAIAIDEGSYDELWIKDGRMEDNPRTEINIENVVCRCVPTFARLRDSGKTFAAPGEIYDVQTFSHGLHDADIRATPAIGGFAAQTDGVVYDPTKAPAVPVPVGTRVPGSPDDRRPLPGDRRRSPAQPLKENGMRTLSCRILVMAVVMGELMAAVAAAQVTTTAGVVQGTAVGDGTMRVFRGVPYAVPPVGALRWQPPQPAVPWTGVRDASKAGPACMQGKVFGDIVLPNLSEDCLTLNIHTPAKPAGDRLPVMVWIHGGGFQAGAGSEPRHDGLAFSRRGIVLVTINYRLGVFGFFAHPELTQESSRHASGNYGMLDQVAALRWVQANIAAFGGDPRNVTIFGESAGSFAVSALMASALAQGLFQKAIGESGAFLAGDSGTLALGPRAAGEQQGAKFAASMGAESLAALRAQPAQVVLDAAARFRVWCAPNVDGYFLTEDVRDVYAAGRQSQVPLLAGWNADEMRAAVTLRPQKPTAQSVTEETRTRFGDHADAILKAYPAGSDAEALESAASLASDMFIGYATWKWIEMHAQSARLPVFRYSFDRKIPVPPDNAVNGVPATSRDIGARYAGEIEYVFGSLDVSLPKVPWEPADRTLSETMTSYWANFAKTGDPNGPGLPVWPRYDVSGRRVLHLDESIREAPDGQRPRYEAIDAYVATQRAPQAP